MSKYNLHPVEAQRLLDALLKLKKKGPREKSKGLCSYLLYETSKDIPGYLVKEWPEYSGIPGFPVPHSRYDEGYWYLTCHDKWDKRTEYGKARWRLVDFLIEKLKEIVNEQ